MLLGSLTVVVVGTAIAAVPDPSERLLLIVVPEALRAPVDEYAAACRDENLACSVSTLEWVLAHNPGADDPEKLKHWLYDCWKNPGNNGPGLAFVLLVGDADVMPVRYMVLDRYTPAAANHAFYPCDLYYADLAKADRSFDDWNGNREGFHAAYYGEVHGETNKSDPMNYDGVDYRPDIAIGRWPVSTIDEVRTIAEKSLRYRRWIMGGAPATVGLVASGGWVENRSSTDALAEKLPRWTVEKRYFSDAERDDKTPPPDQAQVVSLLDAGTPLILHSGHGSPDGWDGSLTLACLPGLRNADHPAVLFSAGCSTALLAVQAPYDGYTDIDGHDHAGTNSGEVFEAPPPPPSPYQRGPFNLTGFGEQSLRAGPAGAVAYIGCDTGSQPCGMALMDGFVAALGSPDGEQVRLGDCWRLALTSYYDSQGLATLKPTEDWYPASIFFQGMKFLLFGDPSLPMPGGADSPAQGSGNDHPVSKE